ncbi:unnamed protein product [Acanthoscelides obtectus]|uniref:Uncharacterized protein n=1 Tax=Acanthoscelides obtectus TaxID=200917 RepID=A0A9P0KN22_ACAOB|nr:unnamed protein product [Acanthoscelides obtectus]CAK1667559.1 hypothetical protein AOBTE_LOCUS25910 [Acanthoscelides obtectus]
MCYAKVVEFFVFPESDLHNRVTRIYKGVWSCKLRSEVSRPPATSTNF